MKKLLISILFLTGIMAGFTTCNNKVNTTCHLAKSNTAPVDMDVIFEADKTGDGVISTLTYQVGSLTKTFSNPPLPWSDTVSAKAGDEISITATGNTTNGTLSVSFHGENGKDHVKASDFCAHSY
jgi:hypothetical protein